MVENLRIWNQAATPPKDALKEVTYGRKYTSIDAYWCIREATRAFGPLGIGWGYDVYHETAELPGKGGTVVYVRACLDLWFVADGTRSEAIRVYDLVELSGMRNSGERFIDDEAHKKATTACISKALSYLGIGSDIYMGKHEGKYRTESNGGGAGCSTPSQTPASPRSRTISEPQRKRMFALWNARAAQVGGTNDDLKALVAGFGYTSTQDITHDSYDVICEAIKGWLPAQAEGAASDPEWEPIKEGGL